MGSWEDYLNGYDETKEPAYQDRLRREYPCIFQSDVYGLHAREAAQIATATSALDSGIFNALDNPHDHVGITITCPRGHSFAKIAMTKDRPYIGKATDNIEMPDYELSPIELIKLHSFSGGSAGIKMLCLIGQDCKNPDHPTTSPGIAFGGITVFDCSSCGYKGRYKYPTLLAIIVVALNAGHETITLQS